MNESDQSACNEPLSKDFPFGATSPSKRDLLTQSGRLPITRSSLSLVVHGID
jgi:hypothetical protein